MESSVGSKDFESLLSMLVRATFSVGDVDVGRCFRWRMKYQVSPAARARMKMPPIAAPAMAPVGIDFGEVVDEVVEFEELLMLL